MITKTAKNNAFSDLGSVLGAGFDADMMEEGDELLFVDPNDIFIAPQVREEFSRDGESTMDEMEQSVNKLGFLQTVLLRRTPEGPKPYRLVAGGRRVETAIRTSKNVPAIARTMTDEQERDSQLAENIHRLNLSKIEEAKRIQEDLNTLGSVEAVLEKHSKNRSWLSKMLSLLSLPGETQRLVSEKISADLEVIQTVKQVEKIDPELAKKTVNKLKETRGKEDARAIAKEAKESVKPKKSGGSVATLKDKKHEAPSDTKTLTLDGVESAPNWPFVPAGADKEDKKRPPALTPSESLERIYSLIFESGSNPKVVLDLLPKDEHEAVDAWLNAFYDAGTQTKDVGRVVIENFRKNLFAADGAGALAMIAFLQGADSDVKKFNLLNVVGSVKA